jgi:DNA-binding NarL/FixJ family response regulator
MGGIMDNFTNRQQQIARLLAQGLTQREIASQLKIKPGTVYRHTNDMRRSTGIRSTTTIAIKAMIEG